MMEVIQALVAPIVYMFLMCLVVSTVMYAFITMLQTVWQAIRSFKGFLP